MAIMTAYDLPIQDERLSPYNLPNQINPLRGAFTAFGLEVLNNVGTYKSLAQTGTSFVRDATDGFFSESPEVSAPLSAADLGRVNKFYPELEIGKEASREQIEAAIDRREREKALEYLEMHASPGFASSAAIFTGEVAGSLTDVPALKGTKWVTKGITRGSELLATKVAESAVSRLGGTASVKAQQLITDNAGKLAFLKGGAGLATFTGIHELETQGTSRLTGVLTPNEADYRLMDGVFNVASSGLVGGLLGLTAEKITGKMIDKAFVSHTKGKDTSGIDADIEEKEGDYLYRGSSKRFFDFRRYPDAEFDKGFWFADTKEHAEFYGKHISKIKKSDDFKIFDVDNNNDPELSAIYKELHKNAITFEAFKRVKLKGSHKTEFDNAKKNRVVLINKFLEAAKAKGYIGLKRREGFHDDWGVNTTQQGKEVQRKNETMFFEDPVKKAKKVLKQQARDEFLKNIHTMSFEPGSPSELFKKSAAVVKAFFQSSQEATERETLDNVSQALEAGKEPDNVYIHEVNRHDAWKRLQGYLSQAEITPDDFIESLEAQHKDLSDALDVENPSMEALQELATNRALIDLAGKTETDVMPSDEAKASFIRSMRQNQVHFEDAQQPYVDIHTAPEGAQNILNERVQAFSHEEMQVLADKANTFAKRAMKRRSLLDFEKPLTEFIRTYGNQIAGEIEGGATLDAEYLRKWFDFLAPDALTDIEGLVDANKSDIDFVLENVAQVLEDLKRKAKGAAFEASPDLLETTIKRQFEYVKAQVIRSQRDAIAYEQKLQTLVNAVKALDNKEGEGLRQGINALLDRSLFQFEGANTGTFRKMNLAEQYFKAQLNIELDTLKVMEFWNDTNSSTEITRAIYNHDMGLPMDDLSPAARKIAEMVNKFYDKVIELYAKEGVLIPKLKGRIHHQWHNPYRIMRMSFRDRIKLTRGERRDKQFELWHDFIKDKIDLEKTFDSSVIPEEGDPYIDINDPQQVKDFYRRTFDKIVERDYRREKTNLLTKRSKQRVLQFKSPEDFAAYNRKFGAGDAQSSIIRELTGMFREVELIKDWGAEPEAMLEAVLKHAESLPGYKEYKLRKDMDTPRRLMHLMRFGAANANADSWQGMFSETIRNLKAYESVTKLGNLVFLNLADSMVSANALNRFSIPMQESILKGIKETFSRYTPEEKADYQRMFKISKEQYFGGFYRHFEDGTMSDRLHKMIRITMKITGTENSEYSNRSMISQSLSNWFAKNLKTTDFDSLDKTSRGTLLRYDIGQNEWALFKHAVKKYKGDDYLGWDNILELSDRKIRTYLKAEGVKYVTKDRIDMTRDDLAQRYRLLMQDQMDDALNHKSLIETDLLRFKRDATTPSPINDVINGMMLFKTYGFMWIRRHVGDRIYGRGATGYRISQIQGTADWHGLMKLMMLSFGMELAINQMKSLATDGKPKPLDGQTAMDALIGSLGPISYLTRIDGSNLLGSITRMAAGPIGSDVERAARIATQFERGFWKGNYTNAQVNSINFLASQFGGVPMLKTALNTLLFDNMIQNIKGKRVGHVIDTVASNNQ